MTILINIVRDLTLPPNAILASLDVVSLYTNIQCNEGIHATGIILMRYHPYIELLVSIIDLPLYTLIHGANPLK